MTATTAGVHTTVVGESGVPVAFLHGLFGQGRNFTQIAKVLQPDYRSLLVDLPNHGRSAWTDGFCYDETADLVAAELRAGFAAGGPVHLVGHSMGGKVAMVLALRHPDLVRRLVVVDIAPGESAGASEFEHLLGSLAAVDLVTLVRRADAEDVLREAIPDDRVAASSCRTSAPRPEASSGSPTSPCCAASCRRSAASRHSRVSSTTRCSGWRASTRRTSPPTTPR